MDVAHLRTLPGQVVLLHHGHGHATLNELTRQPKSGDDSEAGVGNTRSYRTNIIWQRKQ